MAAKLLEKIGLEWPIFQAPMAGTSTPAMAAAVSNAGALGAIGVAAESTEGAEKMIRATQGLTNCAFNVNVFCHRRAIPDAAVEAAWISRLKPQFTALGAEPPTALREIYQTFRGNTAMTALLLEARPAIVSFHFGLPEKDQIKALKEAGIILFGSATSLPEAKQLTEAGIDAIVAQGYEAGGHRGLFEYAAPDDRLGTFALTRLLVKNFDRPVIAAGGIMDGADIKRALDGGAQAVQMGTAFLVCDESSINPTYKQRLLTAGDHRTRLTRTFSGRYARGLENRFMHEMAAVEKQIPAYPIQNALTGANRAEAGKRGETELMSLWCGTGVARARPMPAAKLVETLLAEIAAA